jgi:hypothetical protein
MIRLTEQQDGKQKNDANRDPLESLGRANNEHPHIENESEQTNAHQYVAAQKWFHTTLN